MTITFSHTNIAAAATEFLDAADTAKVFKFYGEMGAGKTTFIQAVCRQLGVTGNMSSPTFSIINNYLSAEGETIYHIDLYRLNSVQEAIEAGVEEAIYSGDKCFVEWPERAIALFDAQAVNVHINVVEGEGDARRIDILDNR